MFGRRHSSRVPEQQRIIPNNPIDAISAVETLLYTYMNSKEIRTYIADHVLASVNSNSTLGARFAVRTQLSEKIRAQVLLANLNSELIVEKIKQIAKVFDISIDSDTTAVEVIAKLRIALHSVEQRTHYARNAETKGAAIVSASKIAAKTRKPIMIGGATPIKTAATDARTTHEFSSRM